MFYYFPKNQNYCLFYSHSNVLTTRLFNSLSLQISSKNSLFFRLRKSTLGHRLYKIVDGEVFKFNPPFNGKLLGYKNNENIILFEFNEHEKPISIYKKKADSWLKSPFLGYSLIESYRLSEFYLKKELIKKALAIRWKEIKKNGFLHGDFTHFNILINSQNSIFFIDQKDISNSKIFDIYYFYSYYFQCLKNCKTLSDEHLKFITVDLQGIIKEVLQNEPKLELKKDLEAINNKDSKGLIFEKQHTYLEDFKKMLLS